MKQVFEQHNLKVLKVRLLLNERGQSKGTGFAEFESPEDAEYAVNEISGLDLDGTNRNICIAYANQGGTGAGGDRGGY